MTWDYCQSCGAKMAPLSKAEIVIGVEICKVCTYEHKKDDYLLAARVEALNELIEETIAKHIHIPNGE